MNRKFFIPALIAAVFAASAPALAQDRGQYNGERRDANWQQQQDAQRGDDSRRGDYRRDGRRDDYRRDGRDGRDGGWRDDDRRDGRRDYHARNDDRRYRGAGPNHDLRRGARLPSRFHHRHFVVDNWRGHRLSAPPRGYHWVQTGDDYVLAAIATGLIAQVILNN